MGDFNAFLNECNKFDLKKKQEDEGITKAKGQSVVIRKDTEAGKNLNNKSKETAIKAIQDSQGGFLLIANQGDGFVLCSSVIPNEVPKIMICIEDWFKEAERLNNNIREGVYGDGKE